MSAIFIHGTRLIMDSKFEDKQIKEVLPELIKYFEIKNLKELASLENGKTRSIPFDSEELVDSSSKFLLKGV